MTAPDPRLGEIEARLAAVTPGPIELTMYPDEGGRLSSEKRKLIADIYGGGNTAFYAGARDDVAYLLAELRKRDEALDALMYVANHNAADTHVGRWWSEVIRGPIVRCLGEEVAGKMGAALESTP